MIAVIDHGMGNSGSIMNMLARIDVPAVLTRDLDVIADAEKLILPGVGAFDEGMQRLAALGLIPVLTTKVMEQRAPILGICLGMQLFATRSEEGACPGLGWIDGTSVRFDFSSTQNGLRVPHMGWNRVRVRKPGAVFSGVQPDARFYFVHSYHVQCEHQSDVLATSTYGSEFVSALSRDQIVGVQFHPEKSLRWGMALLKRFADDG